MRLIIQIDTTSGVLQQVGCSCFDCVLTKLNSNGLTNHRVEQIKTLETDDGRKELRAVTGPDYGRIYDHELVSAVQRIAGNGTGDTRWKVPGVPGRSRSRMRG